MNPQHDEPYLPVWPPPPNVDYPSVVEDNLDAQAKQRKRAGRKHVWKGVGLSLGIVLVPFLYLWLRPMSGFVTFNPDGLVCAIMALGFTLAAWYQGVKALIYGRGGEGVRVLVLAVAMLVTCVLVLFPVFAKARSGPRALPRHFRPARLHKPPHRRVFLTHNSQI